MVLSRVSANLGGGLAVQEARLVCVCVVVGIGGCLCGELRPSAGGMCGSVKGNAV